MAPSYTILLVEDDAAVRTTAAEILAARGFEMLVAQSGGEALRLLAVFKADVLFADVVMPGLDGVELAKQAKLLQPDLKILLMTGYYARALEAKKVGKLLFKPLRSRELTAELEALLAAG
jgi:two-component system, cell cycle response regulator CpdR